MSTNIISDVLNAPLAPDWTIEGLAERLLDAVANEPSEYVQAFLLDETTEPQSRRLIRPLLAYLAQSSGAESNLYCGSLSFTRTSIAGAVQVTGDFVNRTGSVRLSLKPSLMGGPLLGAPTTQHAGQTQLVS